MKRRRLPREISHAGTGNRTDTCPADRFGSVRVMLAGSETHQIAREEERDDLPAPIRRCLVAGNGAAQHPMEAVGRVAFKGERFVRREMSDRADSVEPV